MIALKRYKYSLFFILIFFFGGVESVLSQNSNTATKHIIEIKKMKFVPSELTVHKGDTVVWINRDFFPHDVTELKNKTWSSSVLQQGKSWRKIITESTNYYCSLHIVMKGKLIVISNH